jgi:glycosyltransferase involved in cell wall biosynthesis
MNDLLFISTNAYNSLPTRKQRFANYLNKTGFRLLFVEPPYTYLALLKKGKSVLNYSQKNIIEGVDNNFYILHSFAWLPFFKKSKNLNQIDNYIFLKYLKEAFKRINFKPMIIWNYMPFLPTALKQIESKKIYDCVDDHSAYPGLINPDFVNELEGRTVELSDLIITTNKKLKEKISKYGKNAIIINNGVDWNLFSSNLFNNKIDIKKKIIYIGAISEWFDSELVEYIAEKLQDYKITLIGPHSINIANFKKYKNINLTGIMMQEDFSNILSESAVAIIPFRINRLTENVDPLKVYEYLAAGIPVVSTPIGGVENLPVLVASNKEDFLIKIKEALNNDSIEKRRERSEKVRSFSWETRYKMIQEILDKLQ